MRSPRHRDKNGSSCRNTLSDRQSAMRTDHNNYSISPPPAARRSGTVLRRAPSCAFQLRFACVSSSFRVPVSSYSFVVVFRVCVPTKWCSVPRRRVCQEYDIVYILLCILCARRRPSSKRVYIYYIISLYYNKFVLQ